MLRAFRRVVRERRATAVYVSHDLAVVAQMADHVLVLHNGQMREVNATRQILTAPANDYTKSLLAAARPTPRDPGQASGATELLLDVRDLSAGYGPIDEKGRPAKLILQDINLKLYRGQTIGVIGESGSGKTTLARAIARLIKPCHGTMLFNNRELKPTLERRDKEELR